METPAAARCEIVAHNYATASENRIHGDDVARRYGFRGGLVPGVASYAYLTRPVVELWGETWLERGEIAVKLVHPVYHGDVVVAVARRRAETPDALELELRDSAGRVCATGTAGLRDAPSGRGAEGATDGPLPFATPPSLDARPPVSLEELRPGRALATLGVIDALRRAGEGDGGVTVDLRRFLADRYRDADPRYLAPDGPLHPALAPELANQVLARTVRLGPWIHAGSRTRHFAPLRAELQARGRVTAAYERNGHEIVELEVALYAGSVGEPGPPLAQVSHRAIVRPRPTAVAE